MSFVFLQRNIAAHWGKILFLGGLYILMGVIALTYVGFATLFSVAYLGIMLAVAGVGEIIFGYQTRKEGSMGFHLLFGALAVIAGIFIFSAPIQNALMITLAASIYLVIRGGIKMIGSAVNRYPHWGWTFWDGLLSIALGAMIIAMWPASSFWAIGVFVGIELLFHGFEFVGLGLLGKSIKASSPSVTTTSVGTTPLRGPQAKEKEKSHDKDVDHFF